MRNFKIAAAILAVGLCVAGSAGAQGPVGPGQKATGMDIPQPGNNIFMNNARQEMTDNIKRKQLAAKAAELINQGHCKEAYMAANEAMDTTMMRNILAICRPPKQAAVAPAGAPAVTPAATPPQ